MPRTSPKIAFSSYAFEIKNDGVPTCSDKQSFSNLNDLIIGHQYVSKPIITFEPDYWLLDGNYKFKSLADVDTHVGLMSLSMSDENGDFTVPPALTITFGSVHSSDGLTLRFAQYPNDYAVDIDVTYYDSSNTLIRTDNYTPSFWEFSTVQAVNNFKKIIITFNSTNNPYRYLRLTGIDFGELVYFQSHEIKETKVIQEISPMSLNLPISTFELKLFSSSAAMNIIDPTGDYTGFQYKKPLDVYENIGAETVYIGRFFVKQWEVTTPTEITLYCIDWIGILDKETYYDGGAIFPNFSANFQEQMEDFFGDFPFEIDNALPSDKIPGRLEVCSYRTALQKIAMACGAYISCAGSNIIKIQKSYLASELNSYDRYITRSQKAISGQFLSLNELVTGLEITAHTFAQEDPNETILYEATLPAGSHIILLSPPSIVYSITGATSYNVEDQANYAEITMASSGTVVITGHYMVDAKTEFSEYSTSLAEINDNILKISENYLITTNNGSDVTQRIFDYFQQRYSQNVKLFATPVFAGDAIMIDILTNNQLVGIVEQVEMDLSRGFISKIKIIGDVLP